MIRLVLGGEKSGKSDYALQLFLRGATPRLFLATGQPADPGFREQIAAHRLTRPADVPVREVGQALPEALRVASVAGVRTVLADSLDFWLFLCAESPASQNEDRLLELLDQFGADAALQMEIIFVSCEIGLGPIAADACTRAFVRRLGAFNRAVAARCDQVDMVVAGLPFALKRA